jgi:uroporphyrinogen decarboxylase
MTGREIGQMAFELKKPPRVPVTLIGGGAWAVHRMGKTFGAIKNDPRQIADAFIQFYDQFGNDLLWTGSNFLNYPVHFLGCPIKDDSSDSPGLEGTVIKNLDEVGKLSIEKVVQNPTMQAILRSHHLVADAIGKRTLIIPTQWAPFTTTARILGVEPLMMATIEDPERLFQLIQFSADLIWALLEPVLEHEDIPGANFSDPVASGDLISPSMFQRFAAPALKVLVQRVKAKGKLSMVHICGNSTNILKDVLEIRPHCFSLENKVNLKTAREILGGKVCVAGNVSPTGAFLSGKPGEVLREAEDCLGTWGSEGGYILTVGCDFSKNVPLENMMALMSLKDRARA